MILSISTSTGYASAALVHQGQTFEINSDQVSTQSEKLVAIVQDLMSQTRTSFNNLDSIVIDIGPGSFTGIRVGLAYVAGVMVANKKIKVIPIDTLQALSTVPDINSKMISAIHCHGENFYVQIFHRNHAMSTDSTATLPTIISLAQQHDCTHIVIAGSNALGYKQQIDALPEFNNQINIVTHDITALSLLRYHLRCGDKALEQGQVLSPKYVKEFIVKTKESGKT